MDFTARVVGSRHAMLDWQRELSSIIKQTERNLQSKGEGAQLPFRRTLAAPAARMSDAGGAGSGGSREAPHEAPRAGSSPAAPFSGMTEAKLQELLEQINASNPAMRAQEEDSLAQQNAFHEAFSRVLDGIKFELDMRQNIAAKQMEALREEVNVALQAGERKAMETSKARQPHPMSGLPLWPHTAHTCPSRRSSTSKSRRSSPRRRRCGCQPRWAWRRSSRRSPSPSGR